MAFCIAFILKVVYTSTPRQPVITGRGQWMVFLQCATESQHALIHPVHPSSPSRPKDAPPLLVYSPFRFKKRKRKKRNMLCICCRLFFAVCARALNGVKCSKMCAGWYVSITPTLSCYWIVKDRY
ncbi:hypothetical protein HDV57DRAFT_492091 [Trichoderma longibrachiatum]